MAGQRRDQPGRFRPEPDGSRAGLGVFEPGARAVLGKLADLFPLEIEHVGEPRAGQRQQADRGHQPRVFVLVSVEHRAEAFEFVAAEEARDGPPRVLGDVGAGVGDMLAKLAPLARSGEHGAENLEGAVGRAGPVHARRVEPCRDPRMVDGIQPHLPEGGHQAFPHVDIVGFERRGLPAALAPLAVAGGEVTEQRRFRLARGRDGLARPRAGEDDGGLGPALLDAHLAEAPEGELAHPAPDAGLHDEGLHARGMHPHPEMRERPVPEGVFRQTSRIMRPDR